MSRSAMGQRALRSAVAYDRLAAKAERAQRWRDAKTYRQKARRYRELAERIEQRRVDRSWMTPAELRLDRAAHRNT